MNFEQICIAVALEQDGETQDNITEVRSILSNYSKVVAKHHAEGLDNKDAMKVLNENKRSKAEQVIFDNGKNHF